MYDFQHTPSHPTRIHLEHGVGGSIASGTIMVVKIATQNVRSYEK